MIVNITMHVREIRKKKGITIVELEKMSGVSKSHISEIERGEQHPTLHSLCLLAGAMDVKVEELYTYSIQK